MTDGFVEYYNKPIFPQDNKYFYYKDFEINPYNRSTEMGMRWDKLAKREIALREQMRELTEGLAGQQNPKTRKHYQDLIDKTAKDYYQVEDDALYQKERENHLWQILHNNPEEKFFTRSQIRGEIYPEKFELPNSMYGPNVIRKHYDLPQDEIQPHLRVWPWQVDNIYGTMPSSVPTDMNEDGLNEMDEMDENIEIEDDEN